MDDIDDLINIAQEVPPEETEPMTNEERFFFEMDIKPSDTEFVQGRLVHWMYMKWCKERKIRPFKHRHFGRFLRKRFKIHFTTRAKMYFIENPKRFKLEGKEYTAYMTYHERELRNARRRRLERQQRVEEAKRKKEERSNKESRSE